MNVPSTSQINGVMDLTERKQLLQDHPLLTLLNEFTDLLQYPCEMKSINIHKFAFPEKYSFSHNVTSRIPPLKLPFVALQAERWKNVTLLIHEIDVVAKDKYDKTQPENSTVETLVFTVPNALFIEYFRSSDERKMSQSAVCAFSLCSDTAYWMNRTCKTLGGFRTMVDKNIQIAEWTAITMNKNPPDVSKVAPLWESFIRLSFAPDDVVNDIFQIVKAITGFKNSTKEAMTDAAAAFSFIITLAGQCSHNRFVSIVRELAGVKILQPYQAATRMKSAIVEEMKNNVLDLKADISSRSKAPLRTPTTSPTSPSYKRTHVKQEIEVPDPTPKAAQQKRPSVEILQNPGVSTPKVTKKPPLLPTPPTLPQNFGIPQANTPTPNVKSPPYSSPTCPPPPVPPVVKPVTSNPTGTPMTNATNTIPGKQPAGNTQNKPTVVLEKSAIFSTSITESNSVPIPLSTINSQEKILVNETPNVPTNISTPNAPKTTPVKPPVVPNSQAKETPVIESSRKASKATVQPMATNSTTKPISVVKKTREPLTTSASPAPKTVIDPRRKPILPPGNSSLPTVSNNAKPASAAPTPANTALQTKPPPKPIIPKETTPTVENIQKEVAKELVKKTQSMEANSKPTDVISLSSSSPDMIDISSPESSPPSTSRQNSEDEPQNNHQNAKKVSAEAQSSVLEPPPIAPNLSVLNPEIRTSNIESPTVPSDPTPAFENPSLENVNKPETATSSATTPRMKRKTDDTNSSEVSKKPRIDTTAMNEPKTVKVKSEMKYAETSSMAFSDTKSCYKPIIAETVEEDLVDERKFGNAFRVKQSSSPNPDNISTMVEQDSMDQWEKEQLLEPDEKEDQPCSSTSVDQTYESHKEEEVSVGSASFHVNDLTRASETARILASLANSIAQLDQRGFEVNEDFLQGIVRKKI